MNNKKSSAALSRCAAILKFWHKVEFFIPFDLQRQVLEVEDDAQWSVQRWSAPRLEKAFAEEPWRFEPPEKRKLIGFDLFLSVFDKAELATVTRGVVQETLAAQDAQDTLEEKYDQEERGELEGWTCFARIKIDLQGEALLDEVSVSTAPWALGRIQSHGLPGLDFHAFQASIDSLKERLRNFRAGRARSLTPSDLLALLEVFYDWAGYRPRAVDPDSPVIVIRARSVEERARKAKTPLPNDDGHDVDDEEDETARAEDLEIDILNSFYAKDIERAIASLESGEACPALQAYLTPVAEQARIDLYQPTGQQQIKAGLRPERLHTGRWLDPPCHAMSLMQQFAINSVFEQLADEGVFSVNGPPGTGKTTLLREIFAENIVRRARALATFKKPGDAFAGSSEVRFKGEPNPCRIASLREEIVGFEMVVASSNNAAVENISRDLPKTKSLGKAEPGEPCWRDKQGKATVGYLRPVACNVAARTNKGEYKSLSLDDEPWGLISCALGKKANRDAFVQRIYFDAAKSEKAPKGFDPEKHQSLWTWRNKTGLDYAQARSAFQEADQAVKARAQELDDYATLRAELDRLTEADFIETAARAEREALQAHAAAQADCKACEDAKEFHDGQLELLKSEEQLIQKRRPRLFWWARLLKSSAYLDYVNELEVNSQRQCGCLRSKYTLAESCCDGREAAKNAEREHGQAREALAGLRAEWKAKQDKIKELAESFPQAACPERSDDLELDCWQIGGLWRDEALNARRSELFAAALQLHEAWLAEVLKKGGGFGGNVVALSHMLSGKRLQETQHAVDIWRGLFMIVPVVSSTFAAFASQFCSLGANSLGWLFMDEAGQTVPQAAVGALWRARRAVVVGDPLQIEPVFTVPIKLIEVLARSSDLPTDSDVAPHRVSAQNLADAANHLGALIGFGEDSQWIGSPLRVHRRCVDPMFSLANAIAYDGKMIFSDPKDPKKRLPPAESLDLGSSAWVHAPGRADKKQSVPEQIHLVHQALAALYQRMGALPPIYIISPFKQVKDDLIDLISKPENWSAVAPTRVELLKKSGFPEWCKRRIGTVHTFQGKEESIVWMVLGCDENSQGAANWAASKPNLLNVALTRAKHRFFMIGDVGLWGGQRHFLEADGGRLPRISPDEFLRRMESPACSSSRVPVSDNSLSLA